MESTSEEAAVRPMIDELELPQVQEIGTYERRALAEMKPPVMDGSFLQNLGRDAGRVVLWGVTSGPEAAAFLTALEEKFHAGEPVSFTADIAASSEIEEMVIGDFSARDLAGKPGRIAYVVTLEEFLEPVEPAGAAPLAAGPLDSDLLGDATELVDGLVDGLDLAELFSTGLERFVDPLTGLLERLQKFRQDVEAQKSNN